MQVNVADSYRDLVQEALILLGDLGDLKKVY